MKKQVGRPKKYTNYTSFGMKLSVADKRKIEELADATNQTQTEFILSLVHKAAAGAKIKPVVSEKRITAKELWLMSKEERSRIIRSQVEEYPDAFTEISGGEEVFDY